MKTTKICLLAAVAACAFTSAQAQLVTPDGTAGGGLPSEAAMRMTNVPTSNTGTIIKKELRWSSKIPLDKTYSQLTPEQKAEVHAMYESLAPGDEPPFPAEGLRPVFVAVRRAQDMLEARGDLNLAVTVGPDGKATKVENFGKVSKKEMLEFAAQVLLMTKYKPAVCKGTPCTGQFPFNIKLVSR